MSPSPIGDRLRVAATEITLASLGFFLAWVAVTVVVHGGLRLAGVGLEDSIGRAIGFLMGPLIMGGAAAGYRILGRLVDQDDATLPRGRTLDSDPAEPASWWRALALVLGGFAAAVAGSALLGWVMTLLGLPVTEQPLILEIVEQAREHGRYLQLATLGVSAVLLAPVAEELLFRVLLFGRLRVRSGRPLAYALSAIAFAAIHGNLAGFVVYFWLAVVFALVYEKSKRKSVPILVHLLNNAYALTLLLALPPEGV